MYLICGLGNPGKNYETTRHNMGFLTIDILADKLGIQVRQLKFRALIGEGRIGSEKVMLIKPQTFMNLSGEALRPIADYYKVAADHIILICDDIDLPVGSIRIRAKGSAGTHNGMRSIIYQLGRDDFPRVRIGIGQSGIIPLESYVVSRWTEEERPLLADAVLSAADACISIVEKGVAPTMNIYNRKHEGEEKKKKARSGEKDPSASEGLAEKGPRAAEAPAAGSSSNGTAERGAAKEDIEADSRKE